MRLKGLNVDIDGTALRASLTGKFTSGMNLEKVSTIVLGRSENYLRECLRRNRINISHYDMLCEFFSLDKDKYIINMPEDKTEEDVDVNGLAIVLTNIYNLLNEVLEENKKLNKKIESYDYIFKQISSNTSKNAEKTTAIFTELKYNMNR